MKEHFQKELASKVLGEERQVVEIDESSFQRKYNRGRILIWNQWILGFTERGGGFKSTIIIPVERRTKEILHPLIQKYVSPIAKMFVTDSWRAYHSLNNLGHEHKMVNHS